MQAQKPDIKVMYANAAEAIHNGVTTMDVAAAMLAQAYGVTVEKAKSKIQKRVDELKAATVNPVGTVSGVAVLQSFDKAREGDDVSIIVSPGGYLKAGPLEIDRTFSFAGLLHLGSSFPDIEVQIPGDVPAGGNLPVLAARVRLAVAGESDGQHVPLTLAGLVVEAATNRRVSVEKWNAWTPERRARVVEAELLRLRDAAAFNSRAAQSGVTSVMMGQANSAGPADADTTTPGKQA